MAVYYTGGGGSLLGNVLGTMFSLYAPQMLGALMGGAEAAGTAAGTTAAKGATTAAASGADALKAAATPIAKAFSQFQSGGMAAPMTEAEWPTQTNNSFTQGSMMPLQSWDALNLWKKRS